MITWKNKSEFTAINLVNTVFGFALLAAPWLFGFSGETGATWTAVVLGALIALVALAAAIELREWEGWANVAFGVAAVVAPWLLGFSGVANAMWSHVGVGLAVAILAAVELWLMQRGSATGVTA